MEDRKFGGYVAEGTYFEIQIAIFSTNCGPILRCNSPEQWQVLTRELTHTTIPNRPKNLLKLEAISIGISDAKEMQFMPLHRVRGGHAGNINDAFRVKTPASNAKIWENIVAAYKAIDVLIAK